MRTSIRAVVVAAGLIGSLISTQSVAEPFGMLNGRTADVSQMPDRSVELGAVVGDVYDLDYEHFGARFNYRINTESILHIDLGQSDLNDVVDGLAFGLGVFQTLNGVADGANVALHGSFHRAALEFRNGSEFDTNSLTIEAVFSGKNSVGSNDKILWNANIGVNRTSGDGDSDTELLFGGGIVVRNSSGSGEFYIGALYLEDLGFGGGYRYFLN